MWSPGGDEVEKKNKEKRKKERKMKRCGDWGMGFCV